MQGGSPAGYQQGQPYVPSATGTGRKLMATDYSVGILVFQILLVLAFGYFLVIGILVLAVSPDKVNGAVITVIPLSFLLPIILTMKNSGGIYENGVKVSRMLGVRLIGKHVFFRYEDVKAFYPAEFATSAQMMEPRGGGSYHRPGHINVGAYNAAFGAMMSDSGSRTGVGMLTNEGEFVLTQATPLSHQSPYNQMMYYIGAMMGARGLPLVREPLYLEPPEIERLQLEAQPMELRWYVMAAALSLGLPFIPLAIAGVYVAVTGNKSLLIVGLILISIVVSTALFIGLYQHKEGRRIRAVNRLNYFYATRPATDDMQQQ